MLHHYDLISLSVIGIEFKGVIEKGPLFFVKDLLCLLCLCISLFFLLFFVFIIFFFFLFLSLIHTSKDQRLKNASIDDIFVDIIIIIELRFSLFEFFLLRSSEIKDYLKDSLFLFADLSNLIVKDNEVIFESVDGFEVNSHAIPSYLLELFSDYFIF